MNRLPSPKNACLFAGLAATLLLIGCNQPASDRPTTFPLTGTVTYNGEPLADANLNFQLVGGKGFAAAKTDSSGKYSATTYGGGDGALPGEYKVAITKYEQAAPTGGGSGDEYVPVEQGNEPPPAKNLLPEKYASPETSGLTATVSEGPSVADFQLND